MIAVLSLNFEDTCSDKFKVVQTSFLFQVFYLRDFRKTPVTFLTLMPLQTMNVGSLSSTRIRVSLPPNSRFKLKPEVSI